MTNATEARAAVLTALRRSKLIHADHFEALSAEHATDVKFEGLDIDSLLVFEFCIELEDLLGVEIEPEDIIANDSLSSLAEYLAAKAR